MKSWLALFFITSIAFAQNSPPTTEPAVVPAARTFILKGRLFERGTKRPLIARTIFVLPHKLRTETNAQGEFQIEQVPEGNFQWVISTAGYKRLEQSDSTEDSGSRTLYLEKESYTQFESTTVGKLEKRDESKKSLSQEEFLTLPGAGGDPVKAVQNLPGVNRPQGFSSQVIIQGSSPEDTRYNIDDHEIPLVFHFGGLTSVIMPEAVRDVDYFSAGYGAEYSRAMGGIISLKTREPQVDERPSKGFFFVDTLKSGALYETKIDDSSKVLVSGRYSYIGFVLKQALKGNEKVNLTVAPDFADFTSIYTKKISADEDLKVVAIASRDSLEFVFSEPLKEDPTLRGSFKNETVFWRLIPQYRRKLDEAHSYKVSLGVGQNNILVDLGTNYFNLKSNAVSLRAEHESKISETWTSQLGIDSTFADVAVALKLPSPSGSGGVSNPISSSEVKSLDSKSQNINLGFYWRNELRASDNWTYIPALRYDNFNVTKENLIAPRLTVRKQVDESLTLKIASGLYYQGPRPQEFAENFGNPDLKASQAIHGAVGFDKDFRQQSKDGWQWGSGIFYRDFSKLVTSSSSLVNRGGTLVPEIYSNQGTGLARGVETQIKYNHGVWKGWLSYTLSESRRSSPSQNDYLFEFDQTHNFNLVASYDYGNNWQISGRLRYVTGNPYTPIRGAVFDSDNDVYLPLRGDFFSRRRSDFTQLDLRFDKKLILDTEMWSVYLDIQNVLNAKNSEDNRYSFDYSQEESVTGLPFLPSLGLKGEF